MVNSRYKIPIVPIFIIFTAYGLKKILTDIREFKRPVLLDSIILIIALVFVNVPWAGDIYAKSADYKTKAIAYLESNMFDKAIEEFKKGLVETPGDPYIHFNLARAYRMKGMLDEAQDELKETSRIAPSFPYMHNELGTLYAAKGLLDESTKEFLKATEEEPGNPDYHNNLGINHLLTGQYDSAAKEFETCLSIQKKADYYNFLGKAYAGMGRKEKAIEAWREALKLSPDFAEAKNNLDKYDR